MLTTKYLTPTKHFVLSVQSINMDKKHVQNQEDIMVKNKIVEDKMILEGADDCDCFDLARTHKNFNVRINGIKTCFHNEKERKTIIVSGLLDNVCYLLR